MKELSAIRREYTQSALSIASVHKNPIAQFEKWMNDALSAKVHDPSAMTLATVSADGRPSCRIVLLKGIEDGQFIFYTNYQSQKGKELNANPACSLNFFWSALERQVCVRGVAEVASVEQSDKYFQERPRNSQIGAWASPQSTMVANRQILEDNLKKVEKRYANYKKLPRPKQWGGYKVAPYSIEFWQGRRRRMHDRIVYSLNDDKWLINRLAP